MVQSKQGFPEEGDLVIATITKIQYHSVFCRLDEYNRSGLIHISEIAPGRIKNITDYVKEGKTLIVKVLRVDQVKGHVDLSIRRVTEQQRRAKAAEIKQQQVVEKMAEQLAVQLKRKPEQITQLLEKIPLDNFDSLYEAFQAVVEQEITLDELKVPKEIASALETLIKERIKPQVVSVKGDFTLVSFEPDGVLSIQKAFTKRPKQVTVYYKGAGKYATSIEAPTYKEAEDMLKQLISEVKETIGSNSVVQFERTDKK